MFRSDLADVPPFARIVSEPRDILDLPEGTYVLARLFSRNSAAEVAFNIMRRRGMLRFHPIEFYERLTAWLDRRDAARLARAAGVTTVPTPEAGAPAQPEPEPAAPAPAPRRRKVEWK